tara:strand:+ start:1024 stop:1437 length:414 start_codon:yes stop_codon:yes gene_type:complete
MAYWLFKSEPSCWSWDKQVSEQTTAWDGVRNYQAANNMKAMKIGDLGFFYHSVSEKRIMGIVRIIKEYYPDHTDASGRFGMVDVEAVKPVTTPISLAEIKTDPRFSDLALIKQSRLSVLPVSKDHWNLLCYLTGTSL